VTLSLFVRLERGRKFQELGSVDTALLDEVAFGIGLLDLTDYAAFDNELQQGISVSLDDRTRKLAIKSFPQGGDQLILETSKEENIGAVKNDIRAIAFSSKLPR
jgi:hypothetical protein